MTPRTRVIVCLLALALADAGRATAQPALPPGARQRLGTLDLRHTDDVTFVGFPPDGKTVLSCGRGYEAVRWDLQSGKAQRRYQQGDLLAVSPDGNWLALRSGWFDLHIVEAASGKERCVCKTGPEWIFAAAFAADGATVYIGGSERNVRVFRTDTGQEVRRFKPRAVGAVYGLWVAADGKTCFTLSDYSPSTLQVWDAATGKPRRACAA